MDHRNQLRASDSGASPPPGGLLFSSFHYAAHRGFSLLRCGEQNCFHTEDADEELSLGGHTHPLGWAGPQCKHGVCAPTALRSQTFPPSPNSSSIREATPTLGLSSHMNTCTPHLKLQTLPLLHFLMTSTGNTGHTDHARREGGVPQGQLPGTTKSCRDTEYNLLKLQTPRLKYASTNHSPAGEPSALRDVEVYTQCKTSQAAAGSAPAAQYSPRGLSTATRGLSTPPRGQYSHSSDLRSR